MWLVTVWAPMLGRPIKALSRGPKGGADVQLSPWEVGMQMTPRSGRSSGDFGLLGLLGLLGLFGLLAVSCGDKDDTGSATGDGTGSGDDGGTDSGGDDGFADPTGDPATVELAGDCDLADRLGGFQVSVYDEYSIVQGSVADGVVPISILEETTAEGECRLLKRNNPHCDPPCDAGWTCDFDGECIEYPANQDLGVVEAAGLVQQVIMEPVQPGATYFDTQLPHPAFEDGDLIEVRTQDDSGWAGGFDLHGVGGIPLTPGEEEWIVFDDQDLLVTWDAAAADARTTVKLTLNIDQHGTSPVTVQCIMEDDGEGTVPASVVAALFDSGVSGFPSGSLARRTADQHTVDAGCLDLVVEAPTTMSVDVDGFTPCTSDADCPEGQTCNLEMQICE